MKAIISGVCGFVGSTIARSLTAAGVEVHGIDNYVRGGSETNRRELIAHGVRLSHGDIRLFSDLECLPDVDWVIDAAALPSILAGVDGLSSSRQLVEHNLAGTINLLEFCRARKSGLVLLSTSRVYSISALNALSLEVANDAFRLSSETKQVPGLTSRGLTESFSTAAPISMYGATKMASETMALEYGLSFGFPVWVNRCGVLAGAGQFGRADQGIFSFWINSHLRRQPLKYIGFGGSGHQVRDCLHPRDLAELVHSQMKTPNRTNEPAIINVSGGIESAMSLKQLTQWCDDRFGAHPVESSKEERPFDIPWAVLDSGLARQTWNWQPETKTAEILEGIANHAEANPHWLELSR